MTTLPELIALLEQATGPSRELADQVLLACGWTNRDVNVMSDLIETRWFSPTSTGHLDYYIYNRPNPLASIDAALTLGRNDTERSEILSAIADNFEPPYTLERCIIFGCTAALRSRLTPEGEKW